MMFMASRSTMVLYTAIFTVGILLLTFGAGLATENGVVENASSMPETQGEVSPDVAALLSASESGKIADRHHAIIELGKLGERGLPAVPFLIRMLGDGDPNLRNSAISALGQLGPYAKSAVPALGHLLEDKDTTIQLWTVLALKKIGDRQAVSPLTSVLRKSDSFTAQAALYAILEIRCQSCVTISTGAVCGV